MGVDHLFSVKPWPHQLKGVEETIAKISPGKWICLCSPTGGGKSKMMEALVRYGLEQGWKVDLKVHRKLLLTQLVDVFKRAGIKFGVRAAAMPAQHDMDMDVQISSMPTEISRCSGDDASWELHEAKLVIVDEAHLQLGPGYRAILDRHAEAGACIICVTATPIDMAPCTEIVVAGKNSELRRCGAHVPAIIRAPWEFDLSKIKREKTGEYRIGDATKNIWSQAIVGSIIDEWRRNNPKQKATLVFAPDVKSSIGVAEAFSEEGVAAAHIDGTSVWYDGELYVDRDNKMRDKVLDLFRAGEIKVLSNRHVMREGIDVPCIYNLILATPFGSLRTYIQAVGRALRYSPETPDHVIITDHGGNIWRHGSPNADRDWEKIFSMTDEELFAEQKEREKKNLEDPPITCPKCGTVRVSGATCPEPPIGCGAEAGRKSKVIIQRSGKLREISEDELKKKSEAKPKTTQQLWDQTYWACKNQKGERGMTFSQAIVLFERRHGFWPPYSLHNMPKYRADFKREIRSVPRSDLR